MLKTLHQQYQERGYADFFSGVLFNNDDNCLASVIDDRMSVEYWWHYTERGKLKYSRETPVPVLLCTTQTPHGMAWD
jgi:hypothetical protein